MVGFQNPVCMQFPKQKNQFLLILDIFSNYICKTGDTLVIKQLVETVSVDGIMESEIRDLAMGEAFICKSDLFITH